MSENAYNKDIKPILKVVGVGGAGLNAVNAMIDAQVQGADFIVVNVSPHRLRKSKAPVKIMIGIDPRGFGTGGDPAIGRSAVLVHEQEIADHFSGADMMFITAGMGSGTGTGATPQIARIARESGALVVAVVTKPFCHEGKQRLLKAEKGILELEEYCDCSIVVPNDRLIAAGKGVSLLDAFKPADDILLQAVQGVVDLIQGHGFINADFNDVKAVMSERGPAMIGMGVAAGPNRAVEAVTQAITSSLLEDSAIEGARGLLLNITGSSSMTMDEFDAITKIIHTKCHENANLIIGMVVDEAMEEQIKVTIIATGLAGQGYQRGSLKSMLTKVL
ncbi:MAG: cell division protein FtsZ [Geobacteraceae bacterium]|nr:cell division protein FtsZ [Geobacteraceae bacterium]